ncbi:response regulator [Oryzifoliimicrobium ureilyticus]|uniref:response regulator n=1 Tax=Oryzifoliimicrobium ureilyticus TaxID=3113724 RepID=UPI0030765AE2
MTHKTVLLVEDELFVAIDIQMTLEDDGWDVVGPFASNREALSYLMNHKPACAILDVRLIDGDVFPVADKLHEAGIPFIFHSGHADPEELRRRYPGSSFYGKPCLPETLSREADRLIEGRSRGMSEHTMRRVATVEH